MTDATRYDDMRDLEDAGLAGYATGAATEPPPGAAAPPPEDRLRPYSAEELAQLTAAFTTFGIPADGISEYQRKVLAATRPGFEMLGIGEALATYGIGHGAGIEAMPAWARLLAGAAVIGFTVVSTRREFIQPKDADGAEGAA